MDEAAQPIDRVTPVVMALREALMRYYKGDCVQQLVHDDNIGFDRLPGSSDSSFRYGRELNELQACTALTYKGNTLMVLNKQPASVTFCPFQFDCDPILIKVLPKLRLFFEAYLPHVAIEHDDLQVSGSRDYQGYVMSARLREYVRSRQMDWNEVIRPEVAQIAHVTWMDEVSDTDTSIDLTDVPF